MPAKGPWFKAETGKRTATRWPPVHLISRPLFILGVLTGTWSADHNYSYSTTRNTHTHTNTHTCRDTNMRALTHIHKVKHTNVVLPPTYTVKSMHCSVAISCRGLCIKKGKMGQCSAEECFHSWGERRGTGGERESKPRLLTEWLKRNQKLWAAQVKASVTVLPQCSQSKPALCRSTTLSKTQGSSLHPPTHPAGFLGFAAPSGIGFRPHIWSERNGCTLKSCVGSFEVCQSAFHHSHCWQWWLWEDQTYFRIQGWD